MGNFYVVGSYGNYSWLECGVDLGDLRIECWIYWIFCVWISWLMGECWWLMVLCCFCGLKCVGECVGFDILIGSDRLCWIVLCGLDS